jgi:uncharacterized protein (DUF433 family)
LYPNLSLIINLEMKPWGLSVGRGKPCQFIYTALYLVSENYQETVMEEVMRQRIGIDPKVMAGKPVIRGTRIPIDLIVKMLAQGIPEGEILQEYPRLQPEDIRAAPASVLMCWRMKTCSHSLQVSDLGSYRKGHARPINTPVKQ